MQPSVVVVGAGISGLAVSVQLVRRASGRRRGLRVICLEASRRPGGNIRTVREDGFTCEWGPTGFLDNSPPTLELAAFLGLDDRLLPARREAERRFVYRAGKLRLVPTTPPAFLLSSILSPLGKLRVLAEPLIRRGTGKNDESVFDFAARRIGRQAASVLVDAMVSGVYAGDARRLSLSATFPKMREMESEHGSLFRALVARRRKGRASGETTGGPAGPAGCLTSFRDGLQELVDALARELGDRLRLGETVRAISDMGLRGWRVHLADGPPIESDAVVLACPAWCASAITSTMDPGLSGTLGEIPSAPLVVAHFGYRTRALGPLPRGFGFLVPRGQGPRILGTLWISDIFEGRAPAGRILMTSMLGGAHDPGAIEHEDRRLVELVREDLRSILGIVAEPYFVRLARHPRGIPQYTQGHGSRLEALASALGDRSGLWLSGNSYHGISVNACIEEASRIAEELLDWTEDRRDAERP